MEMTLICNTIQYFILFNEGNTLNLNSFLTGGPQKLDLTLT